MIFPAAALIGIALQVKLVADLPRLPLPHPSSTVMRAAVHQNLAAAGRRSGSTMRLALDVVESAWKPEGQGDAEVPILAFAERGQSPLVPGPLIRVPQGTAVILTLRNRSDSALVIGGLRRDTKGVVDTVQLAAGAVRELRFTLNTSGLTSYWGAFAGTTPDDRLWKDSQLNGAIVVDPPGPNMRDRILVISEWFLAYPDRPFEAASVINGKGWPHSETVMVAQNDSTRFRVVNATSLFHPLHLHGFYYRIESAGADGHDTRVPPERQHLSNTDLIGPFSTVTFSFLPSTPGNWLFHCHFAFHADESASLVGSPRDSASITSTRDHPASHGVAAPTTHSMRGLVIGLKVTPVAGYTEPEPANARELRLFVGRRPKQLVTGADAIGFALQQGSTPPARDSVVLPGPVLELRRGEPVRIVVRNNLDEPTSVHWHGLEIESFPDGVPHWSGLGARIYSQIAPADSFVAAFTPPRSGTYPYHSHLNDRQQMLHGMYGALLVTDGPRDLTRDHLIVAGGGGPSLETHIESPFAMVNGRRSPAPLHLAVGVTHRLRIVSIHPDWRIAFTLRNDSTVTRWRAIATVGADLPPALATDRAAHVVMGPGQTADFEFTPNTPGTWRLEVKSAEAGWYIPLTVIVDPVPTNK